MKRLSVPAALVLAVFLAMPGTSRAQLPLPLPGQSPTPTPTPSSSPKETPTPKPQPPDDGGGSGGGGGSSPRPKPKPGGGSTAGETPRPGASQGGAAPQPAEIKKGIAAWVARPKTPSRTTTRLLELLADVKANGTPLTTPELARGFGRFPVLGYVWYQDDYGAPRYIPYYHPHAGTDLFAAQGTPVMATHDGVIMKMVSGPISGNAVWLRAKGSRAYFFYGHLYAFEPGIKAGLRVKRGDILGYVGSTGDAVGTPAHVHFEIHPTGSPARSLNPKRVLDSWLTSAENRALGILGYTPSGHGSRDAAAWTSFLGSLNGASAMPSFWTAALDGSTMFAIVDLTLDELLASRDFGALPSEGADGVGAPAAHYDVTNPLAALFGAPEHAHAD